MKIPFCKATVIRRARCRHTDGRGAQGARPVGPETGPHVVGQLAFNKDARIDAVRETEAFSTSGPRTAGRAHGKG